jgi:hypothetical protein
MKSRKVYQVSQQLFNQIKQELKNMEPGKGISENEIATKYT